jgi:hypothetical protein
VTFPIPPAELAPAPRRPRYLRPGWLFLAAVVLAVAAAAGARVWRGRGAAAGGGTPVAAEPDGRVTSPPVTDTIARAPLGERVKVQVVNATRVRGLARRATRALRDRGFDVVEVGTTAELRDSTLVLDRSGHPDWAARAARAMGGASVQARPDSSRYLDLTVLVGRAWRPAAEPLDP